MKLIRYILFIPLSFLAIGIVYWAFGHLLSWFIGLSTLLSTFWLIVILVFFGGTLWGLFQGFSSMLTNLTSRVSPNGAFSFWTILIISIINGIWVIYNLWTMDINYSGKVIFGAIVFTILVLKLTFALIIGSASAMEDD